MVCQECSAPVQAERLPGGRRWFHDRPLPRLPGNLMERNAGVQSQAEMGQRFSEFFGHLV